MNCGNWWIEQLAIQPMSERCIANAAGQAQGRLKCIVYCFTTPKVAIDLFNTGALPVVA